ncbi:MAG: response regulator [Nitrospina sp.]|jgi:DNA-binding NtrC family response regulator|nr:response regulator [Nitrospina sp.]
MEKNNVRILVVDDEENILSSLKTHLELDGYFVNVASSGREALKKIENMRFHIVLTDINMPEMDGIEMLEEIKKFRGETIVIMITAYTSMMKVSNSRLHGAADYILKPFRDLTEADEAIERAYQQILRWENVVNETVKTKKRESK